MTPLVIAALAGVALGAGAALAWVLVTRRRTPAMPAGARRIVFPIVGRSLSKPALDAALRIARAEQATLVPVYLAKVPLHLPLDAALPREAERALPLLEAVEQRCAKIGVLADARIERGRSYRHALTELTAHEPYDRIVVAASPDGSTGFTAADVAWLLRRTPGEIVVLRAREDAPAPAPSPVRAAA